VTNENILDGSVTNAKLSNSAISNVALVELGSLANLSARTHVSFSAGTTNSGETAITISYSANDNDNT
jgi:hypothetical protein